MDVADQLKTKGRVTRGWLGVLIQDVTLDLAESFGMRAQVHGYDRHLCAAIPNNDYAEILVIDSEQIKGLKDLGPRSVIDGYMLASDEPGLGGGRNPGLFPQVQNYEAERSRAHEQVGRPGRGADVRRSHHHMARVVVEYRDAANSVVLDAYDRDIGGE